jgi:hypothetical protein
VIRKDFVRMDVIADDRMRRSARVFPTLLRSPHHERGTLYRKRIE